MRGKKTKIKIDLNFLDDIIPKKSTKKSLRVEVEEDLHARIAEEDNKRGAPYYRVIERILKHYLYGE